MKKMLAILGSPRKDGNASKLLEVAINTATERGYDIDYINIYEKDLAFCRGCLQCKKSGSCVIDDDITEIRKKFISSNLIIISCPTYFANMTAPLKNMFDRLIATLIDDTGNVLPKGKLSSNQEYIIMTTCNTPSPFDIIYGQSTGCLKAINEIMHISGMTRRGTITLAGTKNKTEIPDKIINRIKNLIR